MSELDRIVGQLEEFKRLTEIRLDSIDRKLNSLMRIKWKFAGGVAVVSTLIASLTWLLGLLYGR